MKANNGVSWCDIKYEQNGFYTIFVVIEKGKGKRAIEICQDAGFCGGTVIKARGSASELKITLDMPVEPEKEAVLIVAESNRIKDIAVLMSDELKLEEENTGVMAIFRIGTTVGFTTGEKGAVI